ncbi:MAG: LuxR C-terminal-related transcriptional regulator [Hasllibacter sp.]
MVIAAAERIEARDTVAGTWEELLAALDGEGVSFVIYLTAAPGHADPFGPTNLHAVYDAGPPQDDPFLEHCCHSYEPTLTGVEYLDTYPYLPNRARDFIRAAAESGFRSGVALPMRLTGSARYGGFNLGTGLARAEFEARIVPRIEQLRFLCLLAHRRIEELARAAPSAPGPFRDLLVAPPGATGPPLAPREREIIYLLARGLSRKDAARMCGITENTVAEYAKGAYRKLGVRNRVEAVRVLYGLGEAGAGDRAP